MIDLPDLCPPNRTLFTSVPRQTIFCCSALETQHLDIVVIKSNQNWKDAGDKIAVVRTDDGLTIKKVQIDHHRQQIILQPFNIDYPVLVLDSDWNYGAFLIGTIALQLRFF